jgi:uncharacterized integral membrane protein
VAADEPEEPGERGEPGPAPDGHGENIPELAVPKSRAGGAWKSLVPALVFAAVMVVFVVQNLQKAKVSFLTFSGRFPLALALLVAAALGALVVFCLGSVRIVQLRKAFRRHQEHHEATRGKR